MTENQPQRPIVAPPPLDNRPRYGLDRFHSPRRYGCAHTGCDGAASTLARAGEHDVVDENGATSTRTHNCCGDHDPQPETQTEKD